MKNYKQFNESIRDKMIPKSKDEIKLAIKNTLDKSSRCDEYDGFYSDKLNPIFQDISKLVNEPLDNLYFLDQEEHGSDEIWDYFADYLEDVNDQKPVKITPKEIVVQGQWYCYPHKKFAWWGYGSDGILGWVFTKDNF